MLSSTRLQHTALFIRGGDYQNLGNSRFQAQRSCLPCTVSTNPRRRDKGTASTWIATCFRYRRECSPRGRDFYAVSSILSQCSESGIKDRWCTCHERIGSCSNHLLCRKADPERLIGEGRCLPSRTEFKHFDHSCFRLHL